MTHCEPYICEFPPPGEWSWRHGWTCPRCGSVYIRARRTKNRPWRSSWAPQGHWVYSPFRTWLKDRLL